VKGAGNSAMRREQFAAAAAVACVSAVQEPAVVAHLSSEGLVEKTGNPSGAVAAAAAAVAAVASEAASLTLAGEPYNGTCLQNAMQPTLQMQQLRLLLWPLLAQLPPDSLHAGPLEQQAPCMCLEALGSTQAPEAAWWRLQARALQQSRPGNSCPPLLPRKSPLLVTGAIRSCPSADARSKGRAGIAWPGHSG